MTSSGTQAEPMFESFDVTAVENEPNAAGGSANPSRKMRPSDALDPEVFKGRHQLTECEAPVDKLCEVCKELNISVHKFIPGEAIESTLPGLLAAPVDTVGLQPRDLGYLDDIYRRRDKCSLCWLLFKATYSAENCENGEYRVGGRYVATHNYIGLDGLDSEGNRVRCSAEWQLDGRLLETSHRPPTRRLKVSNQEGIFKESFIMAMDSTSRSATTKPSFLGRRIASPHVDISLLRSWLDICRAHHKNGCRHVYSNSPLIALGNIRFIDLEIGAVVTCTSLPDLTEYATLSYNWGMNQQLRLLRGTHNKLASPGALGPDTPGLPKTILDAMLIVKSLGIRFLWVDALCIIQDSVEDWKISAAQMNHIYSSGVINICAAAGLGSEYGIPGSPARPRVASQFTVRCAGMDLVTTNTVEGLIEHTAWNSRAWTFQERMLSPRSMIFVENRVFFQCRQATWSEDVASESPIPSWTLEMIRSPLQSFEKNPVRLFLEFVELYSGRLLTKQSDRLIAFEGLSAFLKPRLRSSFSYGLPDSYFDFALLWEKKTSGRRVTGARWIDDVFPTWSWSGWHGASFWRLSMISGILLNLHDWLKHHTWIMWYKAEREGRAVTFQPVWSSSDFSQATGRWHGYARASQPNNPYGRSRVPDDDHPESPDVETRPTHPTSKCLGEELLYFWTWTAHFQLSRQTRTSAAFASKLEPGLRRFSLLDAHGNWCGTVVLEDSWLARVGDILEFAAISDARDFSMEELDTWNYYIPEDREVSEWQLYYALLIVWNGIGEYKVAERAGLAKIYKRAYDLASFDPGNAWREIVLC